MWDSRAKEIIWGFWKILPHEQGEFGVSTTTLWDCHYRASKEEHGRWGLEVGILEASNDWDEGCYKLGVYKKKKNHCYPRSCGEHVPFHPKKITVSLKQCTLHEIRNDGGYIAQSWTWGCNMQNML